MLTQTQRKTLLLIGEDLADAALSQRDNLEFLLSAYKLATSRFHGELNDPDPFTILMGVQASALGVLTLANWLQALGAEASLKYHRQGVELEEWCKTTLDHYGIVLPDKLPL